MPAWPHLPRSWTTSPLVFPWFGVPDTKTRTPARPSQAKLSENRGVERPYLCAEESKRVRPVPALLLPNRTSVAKDSTKTTIDADGFALPIESSRLAFCSHFFLRRGNHVLLFVRQAPPACDAQVQKVAGQVAAGLRALMQIARRAAEQRQRLSPPSFTKKPDRPCWGRRAFSRP